MKALPPPYGLYSPDYAAISLMVDKIVDPITIASVLLKFSCYPPAIPRILSCLHHSGRYDCLLQAGWFKAQHRQCVEMFAEIGVTLELRHYARDLEDHRKLWGYK